MKEKRFRYKLISVFIFFLIGLAALYGLRTISFVSSDEALRHSILRLTGQEAPTSLTPIEISPSVFPITEGLGTLISPDRLETGTDEVHASDGSSAVPDSTTVKPTDPLITPDPAPSNVPVLPFSEALSDYFSPDS